MHACMLSHFSRIQLFVTPWTVTHQAPLSMGFSRQELAGEFFTTSAIWEAHSSMTSPYLLRSAMAVFPNKVTSGVLRVRAPPMNCEGTFQLITERFSSTEFKVGDRYM